MLVLAYCAQTSDLAAKLIWADTSLDQEHKERKRTTDTDG